MDTSKPVYRTFNWKEYNEYLVNRGRISLWIDDEAVQNWMVPKEKKRGRPFTYSQIAIEASLTLRYALNLPLRATEGFLSSLFALCAPMLPVPDYTLLCKRGKRSPKAIKPQGVTDIVLDSTGLKVYGEGEWKVRQHGKSKKRKWRKFHIGIDPKTGKLVVHEASKSEVHDNEVGCRLIRSLKSVKRVYADGAYDTQEFYQTVEGKGGEAVVPPRRGAILHKGSVFKARNNGVLEILGLGGDDVGRALWKKLKGYHTRSLVETWISRFKRILGSILRSRRESHQDAELGYKVKIMNKITSLGMPISYAV
jgi:hypothetical protein